MVKFKGKEVKYNPEITKWNGMTDLYDANRMWVMYDFVKNIEGKEIIVDDGYFTATINQLFTLRDLVKSASPDETIEDLVRWGIMSGHFGTTDRTGLSFKNHVPGADLVIRSIEFRRPKPGEPWDDEPVNGENLWRKLRMDAKAKQRAAAKAAEEAPVDPATQATEDPFGAF